MPLDFSVIELLDFNMRLCTSAYLESAELEAANDAMTTEVRDKW